MPWRVPLQPRLASAARRPSERPGFFRARWGASRCLHRAAGRLGARAGTAVRGWVVDGLLHDRGTLGEWAGQCCGGLCFNLHGAGAAAHAAHRRHTLNP